LTRDSLLQGAVVCVLHEPKHAPTERAGWLVVEARAAIGASSSSSSSSSSTAFIHVAFIIAY
jgi:hypothetical protein